MADETKKESIKDTLNLEITVEIGDDRNRNFAPQFITSATLRGRWDWNNTRGMTIDGEDPIKHCPNIPGICITLSAAKKKALIYDPLSRMENKQLAEDIQKIITKRGDTQGPMRDMIFDNLDENDLKTWAFWLRRLLDTRQCNVLRGEVPTMVQINKMPGKIITREYDRDTQEPRMMDVPKRYRPAFELAPGEQPNVREAPILTYGV